jgi:hypothetical protein
VGRKGERGSYKTLEVKNKMWGYLNQGGSKTTVVKPWWSKDHRPQAMYIYK